MLKFPIGEFNLENFTGFMKEKVSGVGSKDELKDAFDLFDRNGDGVLTIDDMVNCANFLKIQIPKEDLKFMFERADGDKDGIITFDNFFELLK
jgi:Ca2+-binding EF-hand superfamily protein